MISDKRVKISLIVIICVFTIKFIQAQPPCNVQIKYGSDGASVRFIPALGIDSTNDYNCAIGFQYTGNYYYITLSLEFKTAIKKVDGDLVVRFTDNTSINVPLTNCAAIPQEKFPTIACNYIVLEKYISPIKTKAIKTVIFRMTDKSFKTIDLKQNDLVLQNALNCLAK